MGETGPTGPAGAVDSVAGLTGIITLSSPGGVLGITPNGQDIEFTNTGIVSLAGEVGAVTLSSPDASITITPAGGDLALTAVIPAAPVQSVGAKTGDVTFATGEGIAIDYGAENADPITISSSVVGIETSGTVDATGFTEQEDGPYIGQYYKDVTVTGMYANGVVVCSTSGTPEISATAWITTVVPATGKITIWTAADPDGSGTWEAHYIVASYGSAPP
jgi:hypothetical protein